MTVGIQRAKKVHARIHTYDSQPQAVIAYAHTYMASKRKTHELTIHTWLVSTRPMYCWDPKRKTVARAHAYIR